MGEADDLPEHHDRGRCADWSSDHQRGLDPAVGRSSRIRLPVPPRRQGPAVRAYSPNTGAMYMPMNNTCMDIAMSVEKAAPADGYGLNTKVRHIPGANPATAPVGRLQAVSVSTGKTLWTYQQRAPFYGSVLATGGNLIFSGDVVRVSERSMPRTGP